MPPIPFVENGEILSFVAPTGGTTVGVGLLIGTNLFVVCKETVAAGVLTTGAVVGVWTLAKDAVTIALGDPIYWDAANKAVTNVAGSLQRIGTAWSAQVAGDPTVKVNIGKSGTA